MAPTRPPVLLLHGVLGQEHVYWNLFRRRLARDGFRVHEVSVPGMLLGDLPTAALVLRRLVDAQAAADNAPVVDVVAHSAGGLVARHYVKELGGTERVRRAVFLGVPNRGTVLGHLLPAPMARQSRPGSAFLERLNAPPASPPPTTYLNLWSALDGVVVPSRNALLDGEGPNVVNERVGPMTHWGFLFRRSVYERVRDELLRPDGAPGSTGDAPEAPRAERPARRTGRRRRRRVRDA